MTSRKALSPNYDKEPSDSPLIDDEEEAIYEETY
ncbi:unnamed protein product [Ixodes pacificus]